MKEEIILKAVKHFNRTKRIKDLKEFRQLAGTFIYTFTDLTLAETTQFLNLAKNTTTTYRDIEQVASSLNFHNQLIKDLIKEVREALQEDISLEDIKNAFYNGKKKEYNKTLYREEIMKLMKVKDQNEFKDQVRKIETIFSNL